jgi:hypothetical protein
VVKLLLAILAVSKMATICFDKYRRGVIIKAQNKKLISKAL